MNPEITPTAPAAAPAAAAATAAPAIARPRTKSQQRADSMASAATMKKKWKTLIVQASQTWTKVATEDLAKSGGDFHRLAGLVQMRHELSREESDRQVRAFLDQHYAAA